ncbi:RIP metalloprotease RseP [Erythrobacter sp. LQ02-29]|uniref:RIP metalloprotease RseP n=1 Tax=Erythrobacter sp. LQ02-29 TaxID=2920384 RepID=UPI001F4E8DCD|nr:RIP metalloprotease RseP [Erythrobacter sp. LQ02-29]MCP9223597.1 RIP metalloprotease RseP [Erythrobacter sp. LQ02-29]
MTGSPPFWMYIVGFLLLLGPLVTVHELGHYLVGRWFGVKAKAFSIGFGKELFGWTDRRGTRWKVSMLPLGGYVQFKGDMNPASVPDATGHDGLTAEERDGAFQYAALWKRALIVFAGPATNIIVTVAIFAAFFTIFGRPVAADPAETNVIAKFAEQSAAREAGLRVGDRIVAINGDTVPEFSSLQQKVLMYPGQTLRFTIERDGARREIPVTPSDTVETDKFGNQSHVGRIGVYSSQIRIAEVGPLEAIPLAVRQSVDVVRLMVTGIGQIVTGHRSVQELGGPIKIAKYSGEQLSLGPIAFANLAALISINLAFINLLPIPALDGGHLAFYAAEAVRRRPVGPQGMEMAYRTGFALVLMLMLFVTFNDLVSLPLFG